MSNLHRKIYESLIKNYITNYDLEFLEPEVKNLSLSSSNLTFPFLYHKPYYIYNVTVSGNQQFTPLQNTYLNFLRDFAQSQDYQLVKTFFDYVYYTTTDNSQNSSTFDFVNDYISYNNLSDDNGALSSSNSVAQAIFNLRALQSYNLDDVNNHGDKVMTSRQIHLNDYASSYIRIPIAFITDSSIISIAKVIEEVFNRVNTDYLLNSSVSQIVGIIKQTSLENEINKHFRFYFDIATLEYYFTPQLTMEDYTMNNIECYGVLALSAEDVFYTYLAHKIVALAQNLDSSNIKITFMSKNIPEHYRVEFDAFISEENYQRQSDISNNLFYRPYNKAVELERPIHRYDYDFISYTGFSQGIKHTVNTTYKYNKQSSRLMEIDLVSVNGAVFYDTMVNLYLADRTGFSRGETGFYEGVLSESYHRDISRIQSISDLDIIKTNNELRFVKNNVNIDTIIFLELYPVVIFCFDIRETEKPEGDVKYTKVRFWSSVQAPPLKIFRRPMSRPPIFTPVLPPANIGQIIASAL